MGGPIFEIITGSEVSLCGPGHSCNCGTRGKGKFPKCLQDKKQDNDENNKSKISEKKKAGTNVEIRNTLKFSKQGLQHYCGDTRINK